MGMNDFACNTSAELIGSDGWGDTLRVHCYWKCNGWRYNMSPVYGYVTCNGERRVVANGIHINYQNNQGQYELGYSDFYLGRRQGNYNVNYNADLRSDSSYVSGSRTSGTGTHTVGSLASHTVSYNANGGTGAPDNQTKWFGSVLTLSNTRPTRAGYSFQGWATSSGGGVAYQPGQQYGNDANITLYAVWKANTWNVSYNANGGVGAPGNQTKTYGQTLKLSTVKPTKTDYNFKGWADSKANADAGKVAYAAGANYTNNAAITLYAVWELAYVRPRINNLSIGRSDSAGNINENGTYLRIDFSWATDLTATVAKLQYKLQTATSWTEETIFTGNNNKSGTVTKKVLAANKISKESSYVARIYIYDSKGASDNNYKTYSSEFSIGTVTYPIDVRKGGKGIAFGKVAEADNLADYNFDVQFRKNFKLKTPAGIKSFLDAIYPVGSIYMSVKNTNPGTLFGGTWVAIAGKFLLGCDSTYPASSTGGTTSEILNINQIPSHNHQINGSTSYDGHHQHRLPTNLSDKEKPGNIDYFSGYGWGWGSYYNLSEPDTGAHVHTMNFTSGSRGGSQAHNNMPPYLAVHIWQRTK